MPVDAPPRWLLVPTILVFIIGVINNGERTRALYLASLENLKENVVKDSKDFNVWHTILKGLVVEIGPDPLKCHTSRASIAYSNSYSLSYISGQLNLLYELLYTKIKASNSTWGKIVRAIASYIILVAFMLFCIGHKHQFHRGDLVITYALFAGVFILHLSNMMTLMTSSFSKVETLKDLSLFVLAQGIFPPLLIVGLVCISSFTTGNCIFAESDWLCKMAYLNIFSHGFKQSTLKKARKLCKNYTHFVFHYSRSSNSLCSGLPIDACTTLAGFIWNKLAGERHVSWEDIDMSLWSSVFKDVMEKAEETTDAARLRELYEARGDRALRRIGCDQLMPYIEKGDGETRSWDRQRADVRLPSEGTSPSHECRWLSAAWGIIN